MRTQTATSWIRSAALLTVIVCAPGPQAAAQEFGQWTWDARLGARQHSYSTTDGSKVLSEIEQREMSLLFGVNGYIIHPAIAGFRLAVEKGITDQRRGGGLSNRKLGFRGDLRVFPTGTYPLQLFASRQSYDYFDVPQTAYVAGIPDQTTSVGLRLRVRGGRMSGLLFNADQTSLSMLGSNRGERHQNAVADWSGSTNVWKHHYRAQRQAHEYSSLGFDTDEVSLDADESYSFAKWRWTMDSRLFRRGWDYHTFGSAAMIVLQERDRLLNVARADRLWELQHSAGLTIANGGSAAHTQTLLGRYSMATKNRFTLAPFAGLGVQNGDNISMWAPQLGAGVSWTNREGPLRLLVSGFASWLSLRMNTNDSSTTASSLSSGGGAAVSHSSSRGVNSQLDASFARNALRSAGETLVIGSDLIPAGGTGTENRMSGRVTIGRRFRPLSVNAYADAIRQEATRDAINTRSSVDSLTYTLQLSTSRAGASVSAGRATVEQNIKQELQYISGAATWRIARFLSLNVLHRNETRHLIGEPQIDGRRSEASVQLRIGAFNIEPRGFIATQSLRGGQPRTNRGFTVFISRDFGGLLPIVTSIQRRGVVR